jgi:hypothetical protein
MSSWSVESWVTLISALTAAVVAIVNAFKGKTIENKVDAHAAIQAAQHAETLNAIGNKGLNP